MKCLRSGWISGWVMLLVMLTGCTLGQRNRDTATIPTPASIEGLATAQFLTDVAPPEGFREMIRFPEVDANHNELAGGRYVVELEFNGAFSNTPRPTTATARAEVWFNQLGSSRRVVVQTAGELLGRADNTFEAVRLGPDSFLLQSGACIAEGVDAATAAGLRAGTLVGGVVQAVPGMRLPATINGQEVWSYSFTAAELNLPNITIQEGGTLELDGGEIWVSPTHNTVIRFYLNLNVTRAIIFDRALPVDGQVIIRYDFFDIGQTTNISVPNGC
jgi:hypothetical protein